MVFAISLHKETNMADPVTKPDVSAGANAVVEAITKTSETVGALTEKVENVLKEVAETKTALAEITKSKTAPGVRVGESIMSSRPYSFAKLIKGCIGQGRNLPGWKDNCKIELEIGDKLRRHFGKQSTEELSEFCAPLSTALMAHDWSSVTKESPEVGGLPSEIIKEIQDHFAERSPYDPAEVAFLKSRGVLKDNVSYDATLGGSLVPLAAQGELIETLRASMVFSQAGCRTIALPPQGSIRFPRHTTSTTIDAYAEGQTISESEIGTGFISLTARSYRGLVDFTDELLRFASIPSVEALIREDLAQETQRKLDRDMLFGPGGIRILGVVNYGSIITRDAGTQGNNGDTLGVSDPDLLVADMADANAPTDRGVVFAMRPTLWAALRNRKDSQGRFIFNFSADNGRGNGALFGRRVIESTNIPKTRHKGNSSALTFVLAMVPDEILIGQAGMIDFALTNSDSTKFTQGIQTVRTTVWADLAIRHAQSVGLIDTLLTS